LKCIKKISKKMLVKMVGHQESQIIRIHASRGRHLAAISHHP
jgi:hypothetical protein